MVELFLVLSLWLNWSQHEELAKTEVKLELFQEASKQCQIASEQAIIKEILAINNRDENEKVIDDIVENSDKQLELIAASSEHECDNVLVVRGSERLIEYQKRNNSINKRLRSSSAINDNKAFTNFTESN